MNIINRTAYKSRNLTLEIAPSQRYFIHKSKRDGDAQFQLVTQGNVLTMFHRNIVDGYRHSFPRIQFALFTRSVEFNTRDLSNAVSDPKNGIVIMAMPIAGQDMAEPRCGVPRKMIPRVAPWICLNFSRVLARMRAL